MNDIEHGVSNNHNLYKTILVAILPDEDANWYLSALQRFYYERGVRIILCSIIPSKPMGKSLRYQTNETDHKKKRAEAKLRTYAQRLRQQGFEDVGIYVGIGSVKKTIGQNAVDLFRPDLLICGQSRRLLSRRKRWVYTMANEVMRCADCDVLILKR